MRGMEYDGVKYTSGQRTWHVVSRLFLNLENQRNRSSNFVSPYNKYLKSVCNKTGCRMPRRSHLVSLTCHVMSLNFHQSTRDDRHSPRGKTRRPQYQCTTHSPRPTDGCCRLAVQPLGSSVHQLGSWHTTYQAAVAWLWNQTPSISMPETHGIHLGIFFLVCCRTSSLNWQADKVRSGRVNNVIVSRIV